MATNMNANSSNKMNLFAKKANKLFEMAGELTCLDGSQIGILIVNPEDRTQIVAWPSPEVALERFVRYQNTPEANRVHFSSMATAQPQPQETLAINASDKIKDAQLLMEKLHGKMKKEFGLQDLAKIESIVSELLDLVAAAKLHVKMLTELGLQDLTKLVSIASELLSLAAAAIEDGKRNNHP